MSETNPTFEEVVAERVRLSNELDRLRRELVFTLESQQRLGDVEQIL